MKTLIRSLLILSLFGCTNNRYVELAKETLPKTVMLTVVTVVPVTTATFDGNDFKVETATRTVQYRGSGVFISPKGHFLTCAHVIPGALKDVIVTQHNDITQKAEVLYIEERLDLALCKIETQEGSVPYAVIADPRQLQVGEEVMAIGNALGMEFSVTHGIVSALNRDQLGVYNMTQSDAFINPGNSGGPLYNMRGELIGINSRIVPPVNGPVFTGLGFSVQCGQIIEFLARFKGLEKALK